jgi:PmbA protein
MEFENLKDELQSTVESALKYAQSLNGNIDFEVFLYYNNKSQLTVNQGIVEASDGIITGNAIRAASGSPKEKRISFTSSSGIDIDRVKKNIDEALSANRSLTIRDNRFQSFCFPKKMANEGTLSKEILSLSAADLINPSVEMVKEAQSFNDRIKMVSSDIIINYGGFAIGNTNGVLQSSRITQSAVECYCSAVEGDDRKDGWEYEISRDIVDTEGLGKKAAEKTVNLLGGKKLDLTSTMPTIWNNIAASSFFRIGLSAAVNGGLIVEGISPLADKIGDQIATSKLTMIDNGQKPESIYTHSCDAEGVPQGSLAIIDKGVLKSFLFNSYYATIFGAKSTGNCTRGGGIFPSSLPYENSPTIVATIFEIKADSNKTEEDLISEIDDKALFITEAPIGIGHSNVSTGDFSVVANNVFLVEKGEIVGPLKTASIAGSFHDGLKNIRTFANNHKITYYGADAPSVIIDGFSVVA